MGSYTTLLVADDAGGMLYELQLGDPRSELKRARIAMIFKASVGSDGMGPERYSLRVPFALSSGSVIAHDKNEASEPLVNLGGMEAKIEADVHSCALRVGPFSTQEQAVQFFPEAVLGLLWLSVKFRIGIDVSKFLTPVALDEQPTPISKKSDLRPLADKAGWDGVDGHYDSNKAVVIPEHKRLMVWEMGRPVVTVSHSVSRILCAVAEGVASINLEEVLRSPKLKLALEIYAGSFFEASTNSRFLQLVTVLEALIRTKEAPELTKEVILELLDTLKQRQAPFSAGSAENQELEKLRSRLGALKKQTIAAGLRQVARVAFRASLIPGSEDEIAKKIDYYYGMRSEMLHEGVIDPADVAAATEWLKEFVPSVLRALLVGQIPMPA